MRIAIIDIGTNTTRLFIAEVADGILRREFTRISRVTRLGAGVDAHGRLSPEALVREHAVLADYAEQIAKAEVPRTVAVMTSAVRDAADGSQFAAEVAARHGWETHVLSGDAEADLTYRGATDVIDPASTERILVVDIGGGSTELVLGRGVSADFHVSTQAGVVRQSDRHLSADPPAVAELDRLRADVRATLAAGVPGPRRRGVQRTLAVAGTPTSLAAIDLALEPYDPAATHGHRLARARVEELLAQLLEMSVEQRRTLAGLHPDRAGVIIPGTAILLEVMALFNLAEVEVSEHDILRGAALTYGS
ncbi:MAG TPA: Ppx/GppA family phosphatase [Solirubrobacteraceae bacterium]|nr:Ppx/GppA family phosphatase [Solirubrobacteraceae bacterium]